ncbi:uncharacterized protein BDV17DRAFT_256526 [Aspergillus undulatus]|uniref:uncharacterized protein n=1 Tax=Aspergillus undulatus TaxID=1810928 RepID=UPI003CCE3370
MRSLRFVWHVARASVSDVQTHTLLCCLSDDWKGGERGAFATLFKKRNVLTVDFDASFTPTLSARDEEPAKPSFYQKESKYKYKT